MAGCVYDKDNDNCKSGSDMPSKMTADKQDDAKSSDPEKMTNTIKVNKDDSILIRPRGEVKDADGNAKKALMYGSISYSD